MILAGYAAESHQESVMSDNIDVRIHQLRLENNSMPEISNRRIMHRNYHEKRRDDMWTSFGSLAKLEEWTRTLKRELHRSQSL